jgi:hypothetical protein
VADRRLDPRCQEQCVGAVPGRCGIACGLQGGQDPLRPSAVTKDDPGPSVAVRDPQGQHRVVQRTPGQRRVDVGAFGAREGEVLGLVGTAHTLPGRGGGLGVPGGVRCVCPFGDPGGGHGFQSERPDAVEEAMPHQVPATRAW